MAYHNELRIKDWSKVLEKFGFEADFRGEIRTSCPIHKGDNPTSLCIYPDKKSWVCWSHNCQKKLGSDLVGLIAGIKNIGRDEASRLLEEEAETISDEDWVLYQFVRDNTIKEHKSMAPIPIERFYKEKELGSKYFEEEGFAAETIKEFGGFFSMKKGSAVYLRHCLPVIAQDGKQVIGVTGRSPHPECALCGFHHSPKQDCVNVPKWLHYGFSTAHNLFNIHRVNVNMAIVTEGPKEPMRLYEYGIIPVVSSLSKNFSKEHAKQLVSKGVDKLVFLYDNDKEGLSGASKAMSEYKRIFDMENWSPMLKKGTDPADLINKEIILDLWQKYTSRTKLENPE